MKKTVLLTVMGAAILSVLAFGGAKGAGAGRLNVTIALQSSSSATGQPSWIGGSAMFDVNRSVADNSEVAWVTNRCWDASGAVVARTDLPVIWGTASSLAGYAGPFTTGGARCEAYVTFRPWQYRPISSVLKYTP